MIVHAHECTTRESPSIAMRIVLIIYTSERCYVLSELSGVGLQGEDASLQKPLHYTVQVYNITQNIGTHWRGPDLLTDVYLSVTAIQTI